MEWVFWVEWICGWARVEFQRSNIFFVFSRLCMLVIVRTVHFCGCANSISSKSSKSVYLSIYCVHVYHWRRNENVYTGNNVWNFEKMATSSWSACLSFFLKYIRLKGSNNAVVRIKINQLSKICFQCLRPRKTANIRCFLTLSRALRKWEENRIASSSSLSLLSYLYKIINCMIFVLACNFLYRFTLV